MEKKENLYKYFDDIIESRLSAIEYAKNHFEELHEGEINADRKVITTLAYDLGIVCPSLLFHKVISGNKRGKIIKTIPKDKNYSIISYDKMGKPVAFRAGNKFGLGKEAELFFQYNRYTWVTKLSDKGEASDFKTYRIEMDGDRILSFYMISGSGHQLIGEEYHYSNDDGMIECDWYYYLPFLVNSSKEIPAGYDNSPMKQYKYEIYKEQIVEYVKEKENYVLNGEIKTRSNEKRAKSTYSQMNKWLNSCLGDFCADSSKGLYFQLTEGGEAGYTIYLNCTCGFGYDDWACDVDSTVSEIFIETNGEQEWENILNSSIAALKKYMKSGEYKDILKMTAGVGIGFADGDIECL